MSRSDNPPPREEIAVIGLAGRFPGAANVDEFWRNLCQGVEAIRSFTPEELAASGIDPSVLKDPAYVNAGVVLEEADAFDAAFFGYPPREAELMEPQHRLFLECAWTALEHAGYDSEEYEGLIGVYGGVARNNYLLDHLLPHHELLASVGLHQLLIANEKDFPATRASFKLNLRGPSLNVQTACSSSGVAIHLACQGLLGGECDLALAGAACVRVPLLGGYFYKDGGIQSPDGRCRAFDAQARGTVIGSGVAMLVLKRLSDALRDGDCVHAVIKGTAINNDGADKVGFTAPGVEGQARAIAEAQAMAGIDAGTISYVEAHGTGTSLGDPIEIAALTRAFRRTTNRKGFCAIGSLKTNIGHLDAGAGVAGVVKAVLALRHGQLPASLNFEKPNPEIDFANSPFYVNTKLVEWSSGDTPRRAGVSSFGLGGTNAHIILEEAPPAPPPSPSRAGQLLVLSAKTSSALDQAAARLAAHFDQNPEANLADAAYTLHVGRRHFNHRRFLVCRDAREAAGELKAPASKRVLSKLSERRDPPVTFMFPGQGAQQLNMGLELFQAEPVFRKQIDACADILKPHLGLDLREALYPAHADEAARQRINQTEFAQPGIFAFEFALAHLWMEWGIQPRSLIGHSVGEYVAACLAGVFSLADILGLLARRGRLMQDLPAGAMLAVSLTAEEAQPLLGPELSLAAINGKSNCVVAGPHEAMAGLERRLAEKRIACRHLPTSHAFHSAMVDPVVEPFLQEVKKIQLNPPRIPFISSTTGAWIAASQAVDPAYWARHLRETVRFHDGLQTLLKEPHGILLEIGPGELLSPLARRLCRELPGSTVLASLAQGSGERGAVDSILQALGKLWLEGVKIDWNGFHRSEHRRRVSLPTYPFERKRFWIDPPARHRSPVAEEVASAVDGRVTIPPANIAPVVSSSGQGNGPVANGEERNGGSVSNRKTTIVSGLREVLHNLSGIESESIAADASFLSLGLDSLFLTQAGLAFQKKFEVPITLRHLLEEHPSMQALADYIAAKLPPEKLAAPEPAPAVIPGSRLMPADSPAPADYRLAMEDLLQQQIQFMSQQLALLRGVPPAATNGRIMEVQATSPSQPKPPGKGKESRSFGPFKPIDKAAAQELDARQQQALAGLIERYTRRTRESRRLTQIHRPHFADPRTVSGFRLLWKEMVYPIVANLAAGSKLWDVDGNEYVDFTMGFGIHLFGHSPDFVTQAVTDQLGQGIPIGPQSPLAGEVAAALCQFSGQDRATFCNTGSEAVLAALRAARTVTGRHRIALFSGSYHGINDEVLVRAQMVDGMQRLLPVAPGVTPNMIENALVLEYGNPQSLDIIQAHAHELAAVLVEPVQSRRPDLQPREFLHRLRELTTRGGIALVFDEVITGLRLHPGGAQVWYDVRADLVTYGKVLGGGLPMGAVAGKARFMDAFDGGGWDYGDNSLPGAGVTFFAGTFVRHPLALRAATAVLHHLQQGGPQLQQGLNERSSQLARALNDGFSELGFPMRALNCGSMFHFIYDEEPPLGNLLFFFLREKGVHIWENRPCFLSTAHSDEDIDHLIRAFRESVMAMQAGGFLPGKSAVSASPTASESVPQEPGAHRIPLTPAQLEIWLEAQKGDRASCRYNESISLHLQGPFNLSAMREAVQILVDRHEALRAVFSPQGDYQEIMPQLPLEIPWHDLAMMEPNQRASQVRELQLREGQIPLDLAHGPLARGLIIRLGEAEHLVVLTFHHIVCDGWSVGILMRDLGEIYTAADRKTPPSLPPVTRFREYVAWQAGPAQTSETARSEAYWLQHLSNSLSMLELPADRVRPAVKAYHGLRLVSPLAPALYQGLKRLSAKLNATLFTTLLAGFEVLVHRLTGQSGVLIGIPVSGQALMDGHGLVGHCTHLLPLRSEFEGGMSFTDFLAQTRREVMNASDHQQCTLGTLVQRLNLLRDPSRTPLVPVTFNLDRVTNPVNFAGLTVDLSTNPKCFLNFDLSLNIRDSGEEMQLECDFDTELFHVETIQRWLGHYITLLAALVADPAQPVGELPLLTSAEREQILVDWNRTETDYPARTIAELFEEQAAQRPDAIAVVFGHRELTYGELNAHANQLAHYLKTLGVDPDKLVGLCMERSVEMVVALLGILKAGGAYVALDVSIPTERMRSILEDAQPCVILTQSKLQKATIETAWASSDKGAAAPVVVCLEKDARAIGRKRSSNPEGVASPENLAYVCFTSGSTGQPKGVCIPHHGVVRLVRQTNYISISPSDVFLQFAPISFDASTFEIWGALLNGARLVVFPPQLLSLAELGSVIRKHHVSVLWLTAGLFHQMVEEQLDSLKGVRKLLAGGDVLSVTHVRKALASLGEGHLINGYGPTENTTFTCCHAITQASVDRHSIPIGRPVANSQCFILDRNGQPVPIGVCGELFTGGDGLARGYLNDPDLTAGRFVPNPARPGTLLYATGDLTRYLPDGNIEFLGRADGLVKIRGFRIELNEIDSALQEHPGVRECVAAVREDVPGEKRLIAYFTASRQTLPTSMDLRDFLAKKLPDYMVPSLFVPLKSIPLTDNGKVDRRALPAPDGERSELEKDYLPPRDPVETQLVGLWEALLGTRPIGVRDRFFDLGGDSLLAIRLFSQIEKSFDRRIPYTALFQAPTIEYLANLVRRRETSSPRSLLAALQEKGSKPPLFLVHGAGGGMLWGYANLAMHLSPDQPVYGIESRAMHGQKEFEKLEDMAAHYIAELRARQPAGPYFLGGYCFGGDIAYEMARQLCHQRERVALLALFEASPVKGTYERARWWHPRFPFDFAQNLYYWFQYLGRLEPETRRSIVRRRIRTSLRDFVQDLRRSPAQPDPVNLDSVVDVAQIPESELLLWRAHLHALKGHTSLPYPGRVTLLRTRRQPFWCSFDPAYGWRELAGGGVSVRIIPGAHESIFMEPNVRATAAELQSCLDEAQTPSTGA
ncbi:MAG: amino acid adenylation protein [Pedosphaera sp.]|nr:amino acid adenylation protein [Pedosphaera sp.]